MEVSKEELNEMKEYAEKIKAKIEIILDKELATLTEEDLKELYYFKNTFKSHQTKISLFQGEIDKAREEIEEKIKKYTLLERSEIVSQEEENEIDETQRLIDEVKTKIEQEGLYDLVDKVEKKQAGQSQYEEWKIEESRKKEIEARRSEIKDAILSKDNGAKYYWKKVVEPVKGTHYSVNYNTLNEGPVSEKIYELIDKYSAFESKDKYCFTISEGEPRDAEHYYRTITFKQYEECSLDEKQAIKEKQISDKQRLDEILSNDSEEYDKKGKIFIPIYERDGYRGGLKEKDKIEIEITPKELAEYGILPEDLNWKSMEDIEKEARMGKISSKDIASASKDLATKDVKGAKGFLTNLLDKVKNMFKGKE